MESSKFLSTRLTRRGFMRAGVRSAIGVSGLTLGTMAWARLGEPNWLETTYHNVRLPHLPKVFDGFKIVHLSDIHFDGTSSDAQFPAVASYVNSLGADAIAITGDFVSSWSKDVQHALERGLEVLQAPVGVFGVLGNHDYWQKRTDFVQNSLKAAGVTELFNDFHIVERDGQKLFLCGLDDLWYGEADIKGLAKRIPAGNAAVVLGHEPDFADEVSATGKFGLMLSGHSHGGQIAMPFLGPIHLPAHGHKYPCGRYEVDGMTLYTNRGLGTVGFKLRFCARPEVTVITLRV